MTEPRDDQRVVVITGAASGIGFATAELFRDAGDLVYGLDIAATVPEGVQYVECNVADKASVDARLMRRTRRGWKLEAEVSAAGCCAYEYASRKPVAGVPVVL